MTTDAWLARDQATTEWRQQLKRAPGDHKRALNHVIGLLVRQGLCPEQAVAWLRVQFPEDSIVKKVKEAGLPTGHLGLVSLSSSANGVTNRGYPALRLEGMEHLEEAVVGLQVLADERSRALLAYTVSLSGTLRATADHWMAHVDLTIRPEGAGRCGHPLIHCHVGPDPERKFQARVPVPLLSPEEALLWLVTTVHPPLEPSSPEAGGKK